MSFATHKSLNPAQEEAVEFSGSHLLIVAGPGTGKTHTLIARIARFIPELKSQEKILAITFTNKAAAAVKDRLMSGDVPLNRLYVGTFHSFCLSLLRQYLQHTALPNHFRIAMPDDLAEFDKDLRERIGFLKSTQMVIDADEEYKRYNRTLRQKGLIDFDDILRETLVLLEDEAIASQVRDEYKYVFVDEYQDINVIQNALLKLIVGETGSITAIGDPQQSIYGFRGSQVSLFDRFVQDFPGARTLCLQENYRSVPHVLTASQQVINKHSSSKNVELIARIHGQGKLIMHEADSDRSEADYAASQIEKMIGGRDMLNARHAQRSLGDIAILYRLNTQRHVLTQALDHVGIPYQHSGKPLPVKEYSDDAALNQFEEALHYHVEKVSLMTIHAAKGLEFPVVFMVGCEDHLLPLNLEGMRADKQEERRLFYVGMTRAKEVLYLTYAKRRQLFGKTCAFAPSPFLSDIQDDLKAHEAARLVKKANPKPDDGQMKLF